MRRSRASKMRTFLIALSMIWLTAIAAYVGDFSSAERWLLILGAATVSVTYLGGIFAIRSGQELAARLKRIEVILERIASTAEEEAKRSQN